MHIGIDATCWHNERGYGRHARSLLTALLALDESHSYSFFVDQAMDPNELPRNATLCNVRASRPTVEAASADGRRSLADMWQMSRAMSRANLDLLIFPTVYSYVPVWSRAKKIVLIHDVIAETFPELTLPRRSARLAWQANVGLARRQADTIVTVSDHARRKLIEHFRLGPHEVKVVGEASDPAFQRLEADQRKSARLDELGLLDGHRQLVYLGGFNPHKNLEMLVDVVARLAADERFDDLRLVMVGSLDNRVFHSYSEVVQQRVAALGLVDRVVFTGFLSDADLAVLLNVSSGLVLPSLMEGFGLPAVEAAACGCPVVATTESPLPELLAGGGFFVDPGDQEAWESSLRQLLEDASLRAKLGEAAWQAAHRMTWEAAAEQFLRIIDSMEASPTGKTNADSAHSSKDS